MTPKILLTMPKVLVVAAIASLASLVVLLLWYSRPTVLKSSSLEFSHEGVKTLTSCVYPSIMVAGKFEEVKCDVNIYSRPQTPIVIRLDLTAESIGIAPPDIDIDIPIDGAEKELVSFTVVKSDAGDDDFVLTETLRSSAESPYATRMRFAPTHVRAPAWQVISIPLGSLVGIFFVFWPVYRERRLRREHLDRRVAEVETKAAEEPARAKFAWDLATVKLEAYFDRNLAQVNQVFAVAVIVMVVGFGFVLAGVVLSLNQSAKAPTVYVAGISGVITQFIGATFMVIYRSTMTQANEFMSILERINSVGMAVQMLDSIPDDDPVKNATRAEMVKLMLRPSVSKTPQVSALTKQSNKTLS